MANSSLLGACVWLNEGDHPKIHSDRGCHYRWPGWIKICKENGLVRSMSRKGCSPDNARCEGLFRQVEDRILPRLRLGRGHDRGVHGDARRLSQMVQGCQDKGRPGLQEPHAVSKGFGPSSIRWIRSRIPTAVPRWRLSPGVNSCLYISIDSALLQTAIFPERR